MLKFDQHNKKTFSSYWNNFSIKEKNKLFPRVNIKKFLNKLYNLLGFKLSIKITKIKQLEHDEFKSYQTDEELIRLRNNILEDKINKFLIKFSLNAKSEEIIQYISEFQDVFFKSPVRDLNSGFGFNEGLILYCILKKVNPGQVIESGVMKGFTTYIIDKATSKNCEILCYDINFDNIVFKSEKAKYYNYDISVNYPKLKNKNTFAFWDDHTNHLDRLKFSIENNIKYNIFDDDLGFLNFHSDTWPPIPSISMLKEIKQGFIDKDEIQWICKNKLGKLWVNRFNEMSCLNKVKFHDLFPNLFSITGYKNHSQCSFLITK